MKTTTSFFAAGMLSAALMLTGCGDDKKKDEAPSSAATQATAAASQLSSAAASASSAGQMPTGASPEISELSKYAAAAAGGAGPTICTISTNGKEVTAAAAGMSCDDATSVWNQFADRDKQIAHGTVDVNGSTYTCSVMASGNEPLGGCFEKSYTKVFSFPAKLPAQ